MARGRSHRFARFSRGWNNADGPYSLREGYVDDPTGLGAEARSLLNVVSRHRGNVSKRNGCVRSFDKASEIFTSLSIIGQDSTSFAVISSNAGKLYAAPDELAYPTAPTQLATGLSTSAPWTFLRLPVIAAQGNAFGMNGTDTPKETDGTLAGTGTWSAVSGVLPNGTLLAYHENTLWIAGVAATPYSLFWSGIGDPTAWPAANVTKFNPDDGSPITALVSFGPYLFVFKERGIWRVHDSETSANTKFADGTGTVSPRSVVATDLGCFFLDAERGVMLTDGQNVKPISAQIQPIFDALTQTQLAAATATFVGGHYYLTLSVAGVQRVLDYDTELGSWWVHSPTMAQLATWDRGNGPELTGIHQTTGECWHLFKDGVLRDNGATFESYWSGPFHTFGAPSLRKQGREIHIDGRGSVDVYVATEYEAGTGTLEQQENFSAVDSLFGGSGTFGGAGTFAGGGAVGEDRIYSFGVARSFSMTFYSAGEDYWELDAYTMNMDTRKD